MKENLTEYYQNRAKEYDLVYQKPERQADLLQLHTFLKNDLEGRKVLEIACGTGYWTKTIAKTCKTILATDINEAVLNVAREKHFHLANVHFEQLDFWLLEKTAYAFDTVFGGFIWSHILKKDLPHFLTILKNQLIANGELIFIDNKYVEGSNTPIFRIDKNGNTYQKRQLQNGETYEVLKNFPTEKEISIMVENLGLDMGWLELEYYWVLKLKLLGDNL